MAGYEVEGLFERGFLCCGIPIDTDRYVMHVLQARVDEIAEWARRTPTQMKETAESLDNVLWEVLEGAAGGEVPRTDRRQGWECLLNPEVDSLTGKAFTEWAVRQSIRLGGMGLRSLADLSPAACLCWGCRASNT